LSGFFCGSCGRNRGHRRSGGGSSVSSFRFVSFFFAVFFIPIVFVLSFGAGFVRFIFFYFNIVAEGILDNIIDIEKRGSFQTQLQKGSLHSRQDAFHHAFINVADYVAVFFSLNMEGADFTVL